MAQTAVVWNAALRSPVSLLHIPILLPPRDIGRQERTRVPPVPGALVQNCGGRQGCRAQGTACERGGHDGGVGKVGSPRVGKQQPAGQEGLGRRSQAAARTMASRSASSKR